MKIKSNYDCHEVSLYSEKFVLRVYPFEFEDIFYCSYNIINLTSSIFSCEASILIFHLNMLIANPDNFTYSINTLFEEKLLITYYLRFTTNSALSHTIAIAPQKTSTELLSYLFFIL